MLRILFSSLPLIWCGMVMGISFMEAPLKFKAPGITPALGAGIGRLVFRTLNRIECVLFVAWLITFLTGGYSGMFFLLMAPVGVILVLQGSWLLPWLDIRVTMVNDGNVPPRDASHIYYIVAEVVKCLLLLAAGFIQLSAFTS